MTPETEPSLETTVVQKEEKSNRLKELLAIVPLNPSIDPVARRSPISVMIWKGEEW